MRRLALALALLVGAAAAAPPQEAGPGAPVVVHVRVEGALDLGTLALLQRSIRAAERTEERRLLVSIDTPGGPVDVMWRMAKALDGAVRGGVQVVGWIDDRALSAGVLLAISCQRVFARTRSTIGAAQPVRPGPEGLVPVSAKETAALASTVRAWAEDHGRPAVVAGAMVDPEAGVVRVRENGELKVISSDEWADRRLRGDEPEYVSEVSAPGSLLALTGLEALELRFVDGLAESLDEVVERMGAPGASLVTVERTASEDLLGVLVQLEPLLLVLGLVLAFMELKAPGFGAPGIASIVCFAVLFIGRYLVGLADVPHVVLAGLGLALIAVELFLIPGTLWAGLAGVACLLGGLVLGRLGADFRPGHALDRELLRRSVTQLVLTGLAAAFALWAIARFLPHTPVLRRFVLKVDDAGPVFASAYPRAERQAPTAELLGALGVARTPLRPVGKVGLDARPGEELEARSSGAVVEAGARVRVVELSLGRLVVEPVLQDGPEGEPRP